MLSKTMNCRTTTGALFAAAIALGGCLDRDEKIVVKSDGSADITVHITGDTSDYEHGDAMPSEAGGWVLTTKPADKADKVDVTARLTAAAGKFPASYATTPGAASLSLRMPTEIWIEDRPDGRYYQFKRIYQRRADARYTLVKREAERDPKRAKLLETPPEKLTPGERAQLLAEFRDAEIEKQHQFVYAGIAAVPDRPQDTGLRILRAVAKGADAFNLERALELLARPPSPDRDAAIEQAAKDFLAGIDAAVNTAIIAEKLGAKDEAAFREAMAHERSMREVTEDIGDESFKVELILPGEIVASNGTASGNAVTWSFDGYALMDRDQPLMATSRVRK
ncbi:MAG: hypothetical protein U0573_09435 [Phycisphaerales bacterium]|nr:hypothetical protein [Planctomycetota bacterium]